MISTLFQPSEHSLLSERARLADHRTARWWPWLNLVWSVWIFMTPVTSPGYFPDWAPATFASYAVFLVLLHRAYYRDRRSMGRNALALAALAFIVTPVNPGAQGYLIYACAFLAFRAPPRRAISQMLLLLAAYGADWMLLGFPWIFLLSAVLVGLAVGLMNVSVARRMQADAALRLSHEEVRRLAALAERERIGRDLHDLLGHTLSLITLKLELARKLADRDPVALRRELEEAERVARHALAEVRSAVTGIRTTDFAAELASARLLLESSAVALDYDTPPAGLATDVERGLALVLREAVTNIARHADATCARVELAREGRCVQLRIIDNGRGGIDGDGNGLAGMRDRVRALGGTFSIESPPGQGTRLLVRVPLSNAAAAPREASPLSPDAVTVDASELRA
ncbi:MAG: sensor histidine kinase [Lysobacter sp.]|nr:sensor histidine kinase [Lysobacter sp.]